MFSLIQGDSADEEIFTGVTLLAQLTRTPNRPRHTHMDKFFFIIFSLKRNTDSYKKYVLKDESKPTQRSLDYVEKSTHAIQDQKSFNM
jgi:hypothetical protein